MPEISLMSPQDTSAIPYFEQYFGVWAMKEDRFRGAVEQVQKLDLNVHLQSSAPVAAVKRAADGTRFEVERGFAFINLNGTLMKHASSFSGGTSTALARRQIRAAVADEEVHTIVLLVDSPGGTVAGIQELNVEVSRANAIKPVIAQFEDLSASAAIWATVGARKIFATNDSTLVGSIGVFSVVHDLSEAAAAAGVKVHVISSGEFKGMGVEGTEITDAQLKEFQRVVSGFNTMFVKAVAAGRKMSQAAVREIADGRVHFANDALDLKLIDGVQSLDETLSQFSPRSNRRTKAMSEQSHTNDIGASIKTGQHESAVGELLISGAGPATFHELKAGLPGADSNFICGQLEANATLEQARSAWMAEQDRRLKASQEEAKKAAAAPAKPGLPDSVASSSKPADTGGTGDASERARAFIDAKMATGMKRPRAIRALVAEDPDLHSAWLAENNASYERELRNPARRASNVMQ